MFFFIGGIQPKTVDIDSKSVLCPSCGLLRAEYKRIDHYLSLFFIPIIPVKRGEPFLYCDRCGARPQEQSGDFISKKGNSTCKACGKKVESDFIYCPFCGKSL